MNLNKKLTKTAFRQKADRILMRLSMDVNPFWEDSQEKREQRLKKAEGDPLYFCRTYLPHYFSHSPSSFHYELIRFMEDRGEVVTPSVVAAPREFAKSTVCSFGYVLHQICFGKRHFIIIGSDTEDLASDLTGYIYMELLYNERLQQDFGELVRCNKPVDDFTTANSVRVKARGRGQRLRGLKHRQWRPDLIILDDLENDVNVRNPELVKQVLDWVQSAVYPAIEADGTLMIIGTILRQRSALHLMLTSPEEPYCNFRRRTFRALQKDGTSLWEARHPVAKLQMQRQLMGTVAFNREKMNEPTPTSGLFQEEWLRYYHPDSLKDKGLVVVGFFDPSLEVGSSADYKAVVTVGYCKEEVVFYVLDAFIQKTTLEQTLRAVFNRHRERPYHILGVEDNLFQRLLLKEFDTMGQELKIYLPVKGVTHRLAKETRVAVLSPMLERGKIRFIRGHSDQEKLIEQLLYFPSRTLHDDGPDALAGAVQLAQTIPGGGAAQYVQVGKRAFAGRGAY
ncbi:MAG: phage terminase large subunit [Desulfobaccales bacterium]